MPMMRILKRLPTYEVKVNCRIPLFEQSPPGEIQLRRLPEMIVEVLMVMDSREAGNRSW